MQKKTLGILLSTPPTHRNTSIVLGLLQVAKERGIGVSLYLIDDGVHHLPSSSFSEFHCSHVKLFVCAYGCMQRQIPISSNDKNTAFCGLVILSDIIRGTDRFLALN
tara:strand:+ start:2017 stop:2337 length:321 start_codon:yes stop_codon:yes gene_type:complete